MVQRRRADREQTRDDTTWWDWLWPDQQSSGGRNAPRNPPQYPNTPPPGSPGVSEYEQAAFGGPQGGFSWGNTPVSPLPAASAGRNAPRTSTTPAPTQEDYQIAAATWPQQAGPAPAPIQAVRPGVPGGLPAASPASTGPGSPMDMQSQYEQAAFGGPQAAAPGNFETTPIETPESIALQQVAQNVQNALQQGERTDYIGQQLIDSAAQVRDQYSRQSLFNLGTALISGSNDNISRMLSKMIPGSGSVGADVVDPLGSAVAAAGTLNLAGQDAGRTYDDQLAVHRETRAEQGRQRLGYLQSGALDAASFVDDNGNIVSIGQLREQDPKLYQDVRKFLATAGPEELQNFAAESQIEGLPAEFFGIKSEAGEGIDWQDPRNKNAAEWESYVAGLSEPERAAVGNDSWSTIKNFQAKGQVPNPHYGENGDFRNYVNLKAPSEGLGRMAGFSNNLIGSDLVKGALGQVFTADGDISRWNTALQGLPGTDQRLIRSAHNMLNLLNAAGITGLAGVETLTAYLDENAASPSVIENRENLRKYYALAIENVADIAYGNLDRNNQLAPEVAYIKKHGAEAFIDNIIGNSGNGEVTILNGVYYTQDSNGDWIELGAE